MRERITEAELRFYERPLPMANLFDEEAGPVLVGVQHANLVPRLVAEVRRLRDLVARAVDVRDHLGSPLDPWPEMEREALTIRIEGGSTR